MANNYTINYNDERFNDVKNQEAQALSNVNNTYQNMINNSDDYYNQMINAAEEYGVKQQEIQQANTDFAIEKIEQQKANLQKDYEKEQRGSYTDYAREVNPYGQSAEAAATSGIARGSGVTESARIAAWSAYQGRIGQARDTYQRAVQEYDNGIKDAMLSNNAKLAEIAYQALSKKLELGLNQFQYKNTLLTQQLEMQQNINNQYYQRWQNVLQQMNTENSLAEQIRQYNASMAENKRQFDVKMAEDKRQFNEQLKLQKKKISSSGSRGGNITYELTKDKDYTKAAPDGIKNTKNTKKNVQYPNGTSPNRNDKGLKDQAILKDNKIIKSVYSYYAKNYKNKNLTESQLKSKLNKDLKNKKLNRTQVDLILNSYGYQTVGSQLGTKIGQIKKVTRSSGATISSTGTAKSFEDLMNINKPKVTK